MPLGLGRGPCLAICIIAAFCNLALGLASRSLYAADLRLGYPDQAAHPFHLGDGSDVPQQQPGMAVDLTLRLLHQAGLNADLLRLPIRRLHEEMRAGRVDGWIGLSYTRERAEYLAYPTRDGKPDSERRLLANHYALYRPQGGSAHWTLPSLLIGAEGGPLPIVLGLDGGALAMPAGFALVQEIRGSRQSVEEYADTAHMFRLLALGRLPAVLSKQNVADRLIEGLGVAPRIEKLPGTLSRDYFLAVSKRLHAERRDTIEKLWDAMAQQREAVYAELAPLYR
ncbi:transporter substrate-binding domain-containing protein [Ferrovibrio sp.]|uniref:transporter substrate-binding domain-containing protein n=1 Tax=Ferrovibrio sp. TaxID=1917215 RepID=UPI0025C6F8B1|nr:transporter substrate-binding domain-containing protein [Ferrovibrio sp.]MBX3453577.1 hypothetical protein [Ferrovibrio sp.]